MYKRQDFHKSVVETDDLLKEKCFKSDKDMYDSKPSHGDAYSVILYRAFCCLVAVYFPDPVSYTHLDVYKRQVMCRLYFSTECTLALTEIELSVIDTLCSLTFSTCVKIV